MVREVNLAATGQVAAEAEVVVVDLPILIRHKLLQLTGIQMAILKHSTTHIGTPILVAWMALQEPLVMMVMLSYTKVEMLRMAALNS